MDRSSDSRRRRRRVHNHKSSIGLLLTSSIIRLVAVEAFTSPIWNEPRALLKGSLSDPRPCLSPSSSSTSTRTNRKQCIVYMGALPPYDAPFSQPEEEKNFWGNDYVPKLDHPGTMPPGTRLEDKPIAELSPVSRIPYPHFQEWPFHYRFPAYQPRRLDFIEWMTQRGLMVEDDGDTRGVRFLGRKRRFRAQKAQADRLAAGANDPMSPDERHQAFDGIDGEYWRTTGELIEPEMLIFEQAKTQRIRIPYIVKVREEKAAKAEAAAAAAGEEGEDGEEEGGIGGSTAATPITPPLPEKGGGRGRKKK